MTISTMNHERVASAETFVTDSARAMLCFCGPRGTALVALHGLPRSVAEEVAQTFNHALAEHEVAEGEAAEAADAEAGAAMQAAIAALPAE